MILPCFLINRCSFSITIAVDITFDVTLGGITQYDAMQVIADLKLLVRWQVGMDFIAKATCFSCIRILVRFTMLENFVTILASVN